MTNFQVITTAPSCLLKNAEWLKEVYGALMDKIDWAKWLNSDSDVRPSDCFKDAMPGIYTLSGSGTKVDCVILGNCEMFGQRYKRIAVEQDGRWVSISTPASEVEARG